MESKIVIYYDGICFVCSSVISALIKMDRKNILYFSPLQSKYAKNKNGRMDFEFHFIFDDISDLISVLFDESRFLYIPIAAIKAHKENT